MIKKGDYLDILLRSKKTIFTAKDVVLLWKDSNINAVQVRLNYYVKKRKLIRLRRGIYAKDENYDKYELGVNILRPSYVSFETVLGASGITFQYYSQIFLASYVKREIICDIQKYNFNRIEKSILFNPMGISHTNGYSIAEKERAFLDTIYRSKAYYFDNLSPLDWDKVFEILNIYKSKIMKKRVNKYYQDYKKLC
ncbi:MAG: type IV toxin-antitoxin system AbiEi family antitoxin domain-containing protein [Patescibacteria group bacterium]